MDSKQRMSNAEEILKTRIWLASAPGVTRVESQKVYGEWATTYEQEVLQFGYRNHVAVSQKLCERFPEETRNQVRILDIGAGTGLIAKELRRHGFTHIDALEPQQAMLNKAKEQNLYENYFQTFITGEPLDIKADSFDAITASGVFVEENHVPCKSFIEMIRLVKPGGIIVGATRETYIDQFMNQLESEGMWKCISREAMQHFYTFINADLICWCYEVL